MRIKLLSGVALFSMLSYVPASALSPSNCAVGARCLSVDQNGRPNDAGTFVAQCRGQFPDFVTPKARLSGWTGDLFELAQSYPSSDPGTDAPWRMIDFQTPAGADQYIYALRDYAFEDMIEADFRPSVSKGRRWFHMPMMNFGPTAREFTHGLTEERSVEGPELGLKPGVRIRNFAVGFYNSAAATTIRRVWASDNPNLIDPTFPPGSMTFKILFSTAKKDDFADGVDPLAGAPTWQIYENGQTLDIRLMQMDVAAAAPDTEPGWVFGTLAYDASAKDVSPWRRMRSVGLAWGNDKDVTPTGVKNGTQTIKETIVSADAPSYAASHLGWAGRMNGPVDNPISGCLSCHSTAQWPRAPIFPARNCTEAQSLFWFRDVKGSTPFGLVDRNSCDPIPVTQPLAALDYSLQMAVAVENVLRYRDINPCSTPEDQQKRRVLQVWKGDFPVIEDQSDDIERIQR